MEPNDLYRRYAEWRDKYESEHESGPSLGPVSHRGPATSLTPFPIEFRQVIGAPSPTWIYSGEVDEVCILDGGRWYMFSDSDSVGSHDTLQACVDEICSDWGE